MAKKIIGWILLAVGVLAIMAGVWQSYQIFTAQELAPEIFKLDETPGAFLPKSPAKTQEEMVGQQLQQLLQEQLTKMIPTDTISKMLNLTVWSIFIGILVLAAGKIATIGANLLKN